MTKFLGFSGGSETSPRPFPRLAVGLGCSIAVVTALLTLIAVPDVSAQGGFFEELFGGYDRPAPVPRLGYDNEGSWRSRRRHSSRHAHNYFHARHAHRRHYYAYAAFESDGERPRHYASSEWERPRHRASSELERPRHYASSEPDRVRHYSIVDPDPVAPAADGERRVCVRTCDGFFFPITGASSRHAARQESCRSLCPDAETKLFTIPAGSENISDAVSEDGQTYPQFVAKLTSARNDAKSCACHVIADDATHSQALLNDRTLRVGDSVVTKDGVKVFEGGRSTPYKSSDFLSLAETRNISPSTRSALAAIDRVVKTPLGRALLLYHDRKRGRRAQAAR